jgi:translation initiation factor 2B subunit (eIF-2B alpha/beta/delta family)
MILEQRFGAAQVAIRATDDLLIRVRGTHFGSVDALRSDIFQITWQLISQKNAVGSLVNLLNSLLIALDPIDAVETAQQTVVDVVMTFRTQLNQRVPDTAIQSMSVLTQCHTVMLYGYSTTVLYALQHALRNGQRIDVICVAGDDRLAHLALVERIAAIGLSVSALDYDAATKAIHTVDAVVVGADTLDVYGLTNTAGTAALASQAYAAHIPVFSFCTSEKFLPTAFFHGELASWQFADDACRTTAHPAQLFDVTPIEQVTAVITERGSLPAPAIEAWLAAERIHPWISGRGKLLEMHQTPQV